MRTPFLHQQRKRTRGGSIGTQTLERVAPYRNSRHIRERITHWMPLGSVVCACSDPPGRSILMLGLGQAIHEEYRDWPVPVNGPVVPTGPFTGDAWIEKRPGNEFARLPKQALGSMVRKVTGCERAPRRVLHRAPMPMPPGQSAPYPASAFITSSFFRRLISTRCLFFSTTCPSSRCVICALFTSALRCTRRKPSGASMSS